MAAAEGENNLQAATTTKEVVEELETKMVEGDAGSSEKSQTLQKQSNDDKDDDIRGWFMKAGPTQRMAALGFVDAPFVELLVEKLGRNGNVNEDGAHNNTDGVAEGWEQVVSVAEVEALNNNNLQEEETNLPSDGKIDCAEVSKIDDGDIEIEKKEDSEKEVVVDENITEEKEDNSGIGGEAQEESDNHQNLSKECRQMVDLLVAIFPCIWKGSEEEESLYITLDASPVEIDFLMQSLDALCLSCFQRRFLGASPQSVEEQPATTVPLYSLLLTRLEMAVAKAYEDERRRVEDEEKIQALLEKRCVLSQTPLPPDLRVESPLEVATNGSLLILMPFPYLESVLGEGGNDQGWRGLDATIDKLDLMGSGDVELPQDEPEKTEPVAPTPAVDPAPEAPVEATAADSSSAVVTQQNTSTPQQNGANSGNNTSNNTNGTKKRRKKKNKKKNKNNKAGGSGKNNNSSSRQDNSRGEPASRAGKGQGTEHDQNAAAAVAVVSADVVIDDDDISSSRGERRETSSANDKGEAPDGASARIGNDAIDSSGGKEDKTEDRALCSGEPSADSKRDVTVATVESEESSIASAPQPPQTKASVATQVPPPAVTSNKKPAPGSNDNERVFNDAEWETVGSARSRGRKGNRAPAHDGHRPAASNAPHPPTPSNADSARSKGSYGANQQPQSHRGQRPANHHHNNNSHQQQFPKGKKNNNNARKMAREILFSVLDGVDDEVKSQNHTPAQHTQPHQSPWHGADQDSKTTPGGSPKRFPQQLSSRVGASGNSKGNKHRHHADGSSPKQTPRSSGGGAWTDHSTAPTYQETVSAVSAVSNAAAEHVVKQKESHTSNSVRAHHPSVAKTADGDGSQEGVETATHPTDQVPGNSASTSHQLRSPAPPLPTLLSPENANSTTSSVASSLEAPHGRHHRPPAHDEHKAVGYHLLDLCDRLSNDMALFMKSRAQALNLRRSERAVLLGALQEVVSGIWSNSCRVEMYGSCATLLDLPSSDLDVVIIGLDHRSSGVFPWNSTSDYATAPSSATRSKSDGGFSWNAAAEYIPTPPPAMRSKSEAPSGDDGVFQTSAPSPAASAPPYVPVYSANGHRVMRLSAEIERLPWAVKVKSIPNATVPVIKILADPSKIPGFSPASSDWQGYGSPDQVFPATASSTPSKKSKTAHVFQPWRGSDVMNGLISLDITFQGPEHGGIGSTEYSVHVVNQVCQEMGIPNPEDTPFVQCLMVLKELLAQRKLNEPYSGGLSSYALLLLLTALMRERAAIREEIERAELHRQSTSTPAPAVVAPPPNPAPRPENKSSQARQRKATDRPAKADRTVNSTKVVAKEKKNGDSEEGRRTPQARGTAASWASVARNSDGGGALPEPPGSVVSRSSLKSAEPEEERKPISFADAVGKSPPASVTPKDAPRNGAQPKLAKAKKEKRKASASTEEPTPSVTSNKNSGPVNNANKSSHQREKIKEAQSQTALTQADHSLVPAFFPQGFDDVIEVLCLGETTSGKLLMHFLLHYGQYFDATSTAIDISGKHERALNPSPYSYLTPYIERSAPGSIDPLTGMLVVDHIVIYDPLEGAEKHNVARRCFAWTQVRWIFAQSYATLSSSVEKSDSAPAAGVLHQAAVASTRHQGFHNAANSGRSVEVPSGSKDTETVSLVQGDPSSPLLRCLLSF